MSGVVRQLSKATQRVLAFCSTGIAVAVPCGVCFCIPALFLVAQAATHSAEALQPVRNGNVEDGRRIYASACAACHGGDGRGTAKSIAGFAPPRTFPDFTRCDQTTPELDTAYKAVIIHGGPFRGFSTIMPSFSEALSPQQVDDVVTYIRTFCRNPHWPRGELNLPLALGTEKAYSEN